MKNTTTAMTISAALLLASAAHAQVTLNSVRVGARRTPLALAKFYLDGLRHAGSQSDRFARRAGGRSSRTTVPRVDSAKANKSEPIVIMNAIPTTLAVPDRAARSSNVKDMAATVAAIVKKAGGSADRRSASLRKHR